MTFQLNFGSDWMWTTYAVGSERQNKLDYIQLTPSMIEWLTTHCRDGYLLTYSPSRVDIIFNSERDAVFFQLSRG